MEEERRWVEGAVSGILTVHHRLETEAGALGTLTFPPFRLKGIFRTPDGRELVMQRIHWWRGGYELREGEAVRATAFPAGPLRRRLRIGFQGRTYMLEPFGFFRRGWWLWRISSSYYICMHAKMEV